jgi:acetyl-CoA carboxylase/biotin carboxylase 1
MRKLATANPTLTYPERQTLLQSFVPTELSSDVEVAGFIEKSGDEVEAFVQAVKDEFCADQISAWA